MDKSVDSFGNYIMQLRRKHQLSQRTVAEKIGIDVSTLCKIEHGERNLQQHMIPALAELFSIDAKKLQIEFLSSRIQDEFGNSPHFKESLKKCLTA